MLVITPDIVVLRLRFHTFASVHGIFLMDIYLELHLCTWSNSHTVRVLQICMYLHLILIILNTIALDNAIFNNIGI